MELHEKTSAPALERGLQLLRLLQTRDGLSLEAIADETGYPKSSLLRILETLCACGVARRDPEKRFYATAALVPLATGEESLERYLENGLPALAASTGRTAEWYVPSEAGWVLVRRADPEGETVQVRARIGFLRPSVGELDAVAAVGLAGRDPLPKQWTGYSHYAKNGIQKPVSAKQARQNVETARQAGYCVDTVLNSNGVRRMACPVLRNGTLVGILALAEYTHPGAEDTWQTQLPALRETTRQWNA